MTGPAVSWLPDGRRLHLNHGPIDLIVEAFGPEAERRTAYRQAVARFRAVLDELVAELAALRSPAATTPRAFLSSTARRMEQAVFPHAPLFVTPMAAVAGSVADEVLGSLVAGRSLERAYVNNGGDIALHLAPGQAFHAAIAGIGHGFADRLTIRADDAVRGIATSGWRGRSHSLGIADAVTVLARSAAAADAAATLIANAVDLPGHPAIARVAACALDPDSDLGDRLVTREVGILSPDDIRAALESGLATAESMRRRGLIEGAALFLGGKSRLCGGSLLRQEVTTAIPPLPPATPSCKGFAHA
ncbi:UPF0280 family protein [Nitratireductor pacificus]|uniref:ApbE family lipoprotein n=1 Tax=Nitratireductor pacificus pht-3B TaxID=391937 RepID=K2N0P7_9HYPH|nr:UPF0280 family protein [Nitratireductor pacificus]EKF17818.1 hypothetical protein NA2_16248 [Nitratireductor pacificus pht-3B]